ncbi:MAG: Coproporphyrinogen-III oxidase [Watsoniomyces obsoletus]|nr:MAG: Coproporphyrinogen-III oxidase [Watsoniomyces obsoletus]
MDILERHRTSLFNKFSQEFAALERELKEELAKGSAEVQLANENAKRRLEVDEASIKELEAMPSQFADLRSLISEAFESHRLRKEKLKLSELKVEELQSKASQVKLLEEENEELRLKTSQVDALEKENEDLRLKGSRADTLEKENEELRLKASRVDILGKENEELRLKTAQADWFRNQSEILQLAIAQLASRVPPQQAITTGQREQAPGGPITPTRRAEESTRLPVTPPNKTIPLEEYNKLSRRYEKFKDTYANTKFALDKLIAKYRGEKATIDAWIEHYKKRQPDWQAKHPRLKSIRGPQEDQSSDSTQASESAARDSDDVCTLQAGAQKEALTDPAVIKREEESDLPVVVSERVLRRKKPQSTHTKEGRQQGTPNDPVRVKDEVISSSPVVTATLGDPISESINLDEVGPQVRTPRRNTRKRPSDVAGLRDTDEDLEVNRDLRGLGTDLRDSPTLDRSSHFAEYPNQDSDHPRKRQRSSSKVIRRDRDSAKENQDQNTPSVGHTDGTTETPKWPPRPPHLGAQPAHAGLGLLTPGSFGEQGGNPTSKRLTAPPDMKSTGLSEHQDVSVRSASALRPTSDNLGFTPLNLGSTLMARLFGQKRPTSNHADVASVAEDGESMSQDDLPAMGCPDTGLNPPTTGRGRLLGPAVPRRRLLELLEQPPPGTPELTPNRPQGSTSHHQELSSSKEVDVAESRKDARRQDFPSSTKSRSNEQQNHHAPHRCDVVSRPTSTTPSNNPKTHVRTTSNSKPLRALPLHDLQLEHFKVNSNYNQGLDYAFTETVRAHDRRRCLPGCTRTECCGDLFRKSIRIGGLPTTERSELRWGSSPPQNEDDRLLEEYLGGDQGRLQRMTNDERKELLLHAKAKHFADKHGKHRQAYERRKTPPGFWRTEMPTTQEIQADREEAARLERVQVEERYREAMRPGGRWVFADERQK